MSERFEPAARVVARALAEDLGAGDVTCEAVVAADASARATLIRKEPGVVFGLEVAAEAFAQAGAPGLEPLAEEGVWDGEAPRPVARLQGPARAVLIGERTALNLLGRLSGVATLTARYVSAVEGTGVRILDTRKTTPGLRALEKAAVAAGGGTNHRMGLDDQILIKENHAATAGGVGRAVALARERRPDLEVEAEVRDVDEARSAIEAGAHRLLLDNMTADALAEVVSLRNAEVPRVRLEASGGVTLETVRAIAETGIDDISVGALTHSAPALDLSLLFEA